jgi:hypothetical protein
MPKEDKPKKKKVEEDKPKPEMKGKVRMKKACINCGYEQIVLPKEKDENAPHDCKTCGEEYKGDPKEHAKSERHITCKEVSGQLKGLDEDKLKKAKRAIEKLCA